MNCKLNKKRIEQYDRIILTQPLAHKKVLKQIYDKAGTTWKLTFETDSIHHICPYDGVFRNCADCGATDEDFDIKFCTNKTIRVGSAALIERINDCQDANLDVQLLYKEDLEVE